MKKILISSAAIALAFAACTKFPDADTQTAVYNSDSKVWFDATKLGEGYLLSSVMGDTNSLSGIATATGGAVTAFNTMTNASCGAANNIYALPYSDASGNITYKVINSVVKQGSGGTATIACTQKSLGTVISPPANKVVKVTGTWTIANFGTAVTTLPLNKLSIARAMGQDIDGDGSSDTIAYIVNFAGSTTAPSLQVARFVSLTAPKSCATGGQYGSGCVTRVAYTNVTYLLATAPGLSALQTVGAKSFEVTFGESGAIIVTLNGVTLLDGTTKNKEDGTGFATGATFIGGATDATDTPRAKIMVNGAATTIFDAMTGSNVIANGITVMLQGSDDNTGDDDGTGTAGDTNDLHKVDQRYFPTLGALKIFKP